MKPIAIAWIIITMLGALACLQAQSLPHEATASLSGRVTLSGKPARKMN